MNPDKQAVACGVGVVVTHRQQVLFGRRKSAVSEFEWQLPGGWVDVGESPFQTARREVEEETGLQLQALHFAGISNNVFSTKKHSLSLYFEAECADVKALMVAQDSNFAGWEWKDWAEVSENLFLPLRLFKETGYQPFLKDRFRTYVVI